MTKPEFKRFVQRFVRAAKRAGLKVVTVECPPLNDDLPKFLRELEKFKRASERSVKKDKTQIQN